MPHHCRLVATSCLMALACAAGAARAAEGLDAAVAATMPKVVEWRRDFHQHPELGNRETRTSQIVAAQLKAMGLEVHTGIAHTGVVGVLRGGRPGPVIALRADMDALPVTERVDVPFKSTVTTEYRGEKVGVMHACGHDGHTAILMGAAQVLAGMKHDLPGTVVFLFQPAEEGAPEGEEGGAPLMLKEGVFRDYKPDAVVGLHLWAGLNAGTIGYRSGSLMAASDTFRLTVNGVQTHGSRPWGGVDPIVASAQILNGMQAIVSRQTDITRYPAVVTVGSIKGGIRFNIIPDSVEMMGTIRTFDAGVRDQTIERLRRTAENTAAASGATARLDILPGSNPVVINNPDLTRQLLPSLQRAAGSTDKVVEIPFVTGSEDYAHFALEVPSVYFFVGSTPRGQDADKAPTNHSPLYFVDESALEVGVKAMVDVTVDYLDAPRH
jgi:amidohydrolase